MTAADLSQTARPTPDVRPDDVPPRRKAAKKRRRGPSGVFAVPLLLPATVALLLLRPASAFRHPAAFVFQSGHQSTGVGSGSKTGVSGSIVGLAAKRGGSKSRKGGPTAKKKKGRRGRDADADDAYGSDGGPPKVQEPTGGKATDLPTASLMGVKEDHAYEQFFYDDSSARRLFKIVRQFSRPLLMCNPTLGVMCEEAGDQTYLLLDRDERFSFLSQYRRFELMSPYIVSNYRYDAIFIDPPFANVTPRELVRCLRMMAPDAERARVPVYIGYNADREEELLEAFREGYDGPTPERKWSLRYRTVKPEMEDKIWFFGPRGDYPC